MKPINCKVVLFRLSSAVTKFVEIDQAEYSNSMQETSRICSSQGYCDSGVIAVILKQ